MPLARNFVPNIDAQSPCQIFGAENHFTSGQICALASNILNMLGKPGTAGLLNDRKPNGPQRRGGHLPRGIGSEVCFCAMKRVLEVNGLYRTSLDIKTFDCRGVGVG